MIVVHFGGGNRSCGGGRPGRRSRWTLLFLTRPTTLPTNGTIIIRIASFVVERQ